LIDFAASVGGETRVRRKHRGKVLKGATCGGWPA
jgi:hypothetical protein